MITEMTLPLTGRFVYPVAGRTDLATSIKWYITEVNTETKRAHIEFYPQILFKKSFSDANYYVSLGMVDSTSVTNWNFTVRSNTPVVETHTHNLNEEVGTSFLEPATLNYTDHRYDNIYGWEIDPGYEDWDCCSFFKSGGWGVQPYGWGNRTGWHASGDFTYSNTGSIGLSISWPNAELWVWPQSSATPTSSQKHGFFGRNGSSKVTSASLTLNLFVPSRVEIPNGYLGDVLEGKIINDINDVSELRHSITYKVYLAEGTIIENTDLDEFQWSVPMSLQSEFDDYNFYRPCEITCTTYDPNGNTVGSTTISRYLFVDTYPEAIRTRTHLTAGDDFTTTLTHDKTRLIKFISTGLVEVEVIAYSKEVSRVIVSNNGVDHIILTSDKITEEKYPGGLPNVYKLAFTIPNIENGYFDTSVITEDGFTYVSGYENPLIPYWKLTIHPHSFYFNPNGIISCQIDGLCFHDNFSALDYLPEMNEPQIYYRYALEREEVENAEWKTDDNEMVWGENLYTTHFEVTGFDIQNRYFFEFKIVDRCMEVVTPIIVVIGKPVYDWSNETFHFGVPVEADREIIFKPDKGIGGIDPDENERITVVPCDSIGNTVIGYPNYQKENGNTMLYGNEIDLFHNEGLFINGRQYGKDKILWQGKNVMGTDEIITLSEAISSQPNGIVLVFSLQDTYGYAQDTSFNTAFISKTQVELFPNCGHTFLMGINAGFSSIGSKYLYFTNTTIKGHEGNTSTGTNSGITFKNNSYVLRLVIGV